MRLTSPTHLPKASSLNRLASPGLFGPGERPVPVRVGGNHVNLDNAMESS
jgi:hypothetical protein